MVDIPAYWRFLLKVRERLILIVDNNIRNRLPLEEVDEQVLVEMFEWYMRSDLFQSETTPDKETYTQTTISDIKAVMPSPNTVA